MEAARSLEAASTASATAPYKQASRLLGKDNLTAAAGTLGPARSPSRSRGVPTGGCRLRGGCTVGCAIHPGTVPLGRDPPPGSMPVDATVSGSQCGGLGGSVTRVPGPRGAFRRRGSAASTVQIATSFRTTRLASRIHRVLQSLPNHGRRRRRFLGLPLRDIPRDATGCQQPRIRVGSVQFHPIGESLPILGVKFHFHVGASHHHSRRFEH